MIFSPSFIPSTLQGIILKQDNTRHYEGNIYIFHGTLKRSLQLEIKEILHMKHEIINLL